MPVYSPGAIFRYEYTDLIIKKVLSRVRVIIDGVWIGE
jgi:hypothetical protein